MSFDLRQSTASQEIPLGPFVDETDGFTAEGGLTINDTDILLFKSGSGTFTSKNSGGASNVSGAYYTATLDATDTDTLGAMQIVVHAAGARPVELNCRVLSPAVYDWMYGATAPTTLTAAQIATGVWQDTTSGDFTVASSIGKALYINNVAPGGSGGHLISGSNAGTTTLGALTVSGATTLAALSCTTLTASGAVAFQSTFSVTTSTALAALSCTTLTASGAVALQSTVTVTGTTTLAAVNTGAIGCSTLTASGTVTFNAFTVTNAFTVSGATTLTGAVTASHASNNIAGVTATVGALGANAITAAVLAADAGTEIATAVWASATRVLTAGTNIQLPATALDLIVPADPSAIPVLGTATLSEWIAFMACWSKCDVRSTSGTVVLRNEAGTAIATYNISDNGSTFQSAEGA